MAPTEEYTIIQYGKDFCIGVLADIQMKERIIERRVVWMVMYGVIYEVAIPERCARD